ncbi:MAG: NAD(P)/FAD-dependent oxidoreductase [Beijerinckiaceae bacterium]
MITENKDLRMGQPLWRAYGRPRLGSQSFRGAKKFDVAIIGAGVSGAMTADALAQEGFSVAVLDRRTPATGSTAASTALVQYELDIPLGQLAKRIGEERARRIWQRSFLAVAALRARLADFVMDADAVPRRSLYLQGDVLDAAGLRGEAEMRRKAGLPVRFLAAGVVKEEYGIAGRAALLTGGNLAANPVELTCAFLRSAVQAGARLYYPVEVECVDASKQGVRIHTSRGEFSAGTLVYATGYEVAKGVPRAGHQLLSTWALATVPQKPSGLWPGEVLIWEAADPYIYMRTTPDGRIVCGGEDEEFEDEAARDALLPEKTAAIQAKLKKLMPHADVTAEFAWCGTFGGSVTGSPSIGRVPRQPNCYAVLGYGGNGITFSMLAGQILANELSGRGDPDTGLFSFNRTF